MIPTTGALQQIPHAQLAELAQDIAGPRGVSVDRLVAAVVWRFGVSEAQAVDAVERWADVIENGRELWRELGEARSERDAQRRRAPGRCNVTSESPAPPAPLVTRSHDRPNGSE